MGVIFAAAPVGEVKTRLQHKAASDTSAKLKPKQNQHRDFSLNNYKWSWQGQAASIFNKLPAELKVKGSESSWSKVKSAGQAFTNGSAKTKKIAKPTKTKLIHKDQKPVSTGSTVLNNELNANLFHWIEYAVKWNTNKTQLLS